ncbi:hypothetical protein BGZ73_000644 [Actinomortierella ambigua]|nr:hypothetical protein BGZ73_000644 [Actinomortierella ambigua]
MARVQEQSTVSEQDALDELEQIHILGFSDDDSDSSAHDNDDNDDEDDADEQTRLHHPPSSHTEHTAHRASSTNRLNDSYDRYPFGILPTIPTPASSASAAAAPATTPVPTTSTLSSASSPSSPSFHRSPSSSSAWRSGLRALYDKLSPVIRAAPGYHLLQESANNRRLTTPSAVESEPEHTQSSTTASTETSAAAASSSTSALQEHTSSSSSSSSSSSGPGTGSSRQPTVEARRIGNYGRTAHDGVFANLSAKPQVEAPKPNNNADQVLPSYESAVQDVTPPYYQMTVVSPGIYGDEILVDGMPVGNIFQFLWNVVVSSSFQFVGVLLTFLLHNTHASKSGSMVGLGMTLLNFGYHIGREESGVTEDSDTGYMVSPYHDSDDGGETGGDDDGPWWSFFGDPQDGSQDSQPRLGAGDGEEHWVALFLMMLGWLVIVKALADYARAKRTEMIIQARPESERLESQADREMAVYG